MHLFDFNQALAGKKLLTDKKLGEGLEAPRNSLDVGGSIPEPPESKSGKSEEIPYGYELRKTSSRKPSGMPIKALIAKELSKEPEQNNRPPGVVARLMGLDALPADTKNLQKSPTVSVMEKPVPFERQRHEEKSPHNVKLYAKKAKSPPVHHVPDLSTSKSSRFQGTDWEDDRAGTESLHFRNHPQEQQLQEFKKDFKARESHKFGDHPRSTRHDSEQLQESRSDLKGRESQKSGDHLRSARLDDLDSQLAAKQMLVREKLREAKLALSQERNYSSKQSPAQEESKEFLDAMDFLQSNKEFFMKFLHEPNSLFARHLQDNGVDSMPAQPVQAVKHRRLHRTLDPYGTRSEEYRPQTWGKESPDSRRGYRNEQHFQRSSGADPIMERDLVSSSMTPSFDSEVSLRLQDRQKHMSSPTSSESRVHSADCHVPTRIVVLKPSPGRVRSLRSLSPTYPRSPKESIDTQEVIRVDSKDVFQKLRERLRRENYKQERKIARPTANEHYRGTSRDPREIAREIARQVRENVTRDLMADSRRFTGMQSISNGTSGKRNQSSRVVSEATDVAGSTNGEACEPTRRLYWDQYDRSGPTSSRQNKNLDMEAAHASKEEKRRSSERFRMKSEKSDLLQSQAQSSILRKGGYFEDSRQSSPGSKSSNGSRAPGRHSVDGISLSQSHRRILFHVDSGDDDMPRIEGPCELDSRNGDESKDSSPRTLLRSRSVPMVSATIDRNRDEPLLKKGGAHLSDIPEASLEKFAGSSAVDLSRSIDTATLPIDASTRSIFSRKVSGLKGSFSLSRKRAPSKVIVDIDPVPSDKSIVQGLGEDASATNCKDQCQIEDTGPVADNDSSVSSLENFVSLEAALVVEDSSADHLTSQQAGWPKDDSGCEELVEPDSQENNVECELHCTEVVTSNSESDSLLGTLSASPERISLTANDAPASTCTGPTKEQPEQPSPVSVLDVPFQEERESPMDSKEISSNLQELSLHLRLLHCDDGVPETDSTTMHMDNGLGTTENMSKSIDIYLQNADFDSITGSGFPLSDIQHSVSFMDEMDFLIGKEPEMHYMTSVLVASGFTCDSTLVLTQWYAPSQPIDPNLFQKMEGRFTCNESEIQECGKIDIETCKRERGLLDSSTRHLLFDRVNEILFEVLGPHLNDHLWVNPFIIEVPPMPSGKDLVRCVSTEVCHLSYSQSEAQDTLENLVTKDLAKERQRADLRFDIETVGLEVERAIFYDLIEETLLDL